MKMFIPIIILSLSIRAFAGGGGGGSYSKTVSNYFKCQSEIGVITFFRTYARADGESYVLDGVRVPHTPATKSEKEYKKVFKEFTDSKASLGDARQIFYGIRQDKVVADYSNASVSVTGVSYGRRVALSYEILENGGTLTVQECLDQKSSKCDALGETLVDVTLTKCALLN